MIVWIRRLALPAIVVVVALSAYVAFGKTTSGGKLTGTWNGYISGKSDGWAIRQHMHIVVNAKQTGGSWKISATCHGTLALDNISNGYHHYFRRVARGASCGSGYVDCLKRVGPNLYDAVTSPQGGAWDVSGTLRRVKS
jgi:hypothetical protein